MNIQKYIKCFFTILLLIALFYVIKQMFLINEIISDNIDMKIKPPHSHDYAYKRAYLNPVEKTTENCRVNNYISSCKDFHYKFPKYVYSQPKSVVLSKEDVNNYKESELSKNIKKIGYY